MTTIRLGEVAKIKHGFAFKSQYFTEEKGSYMLLTPGNFQPRGGYRPHKPKYFAGPIPMEFVLNPSELLLLMTDLSRGIDTLGSPLLVPSTSDYSLLHNQRIGKITNLSPEVNKTWLYYRLQLADYHDYIVGTSTGSTVHHTSPSTISEFSFEIPDLKAQKKIAKVLGALDDKINANNRIVDCTLELQRAHWLKALVGVPSIDLSEITSPVLGGTPKRSDEALWEGTNLWASVADMTKASHSHLVDTAEKISDDAIQTRRFSPLPTGAILMSARGTVGRIVSTTKPTSFNQSAYGFVPPEGYGPALRLALSDVVAELKAKSYGSVFSTITKHQINECTVPDVFNPQFDELHPLLNTLESRIIAAELENQALARTRDELLPLLMSGRITVGEAEDAADEAASES